MTNSIGEVNLSAARAAAQQIARCWRDGSKLDALPDDIRPHDLASAYAAQAALVDVMDDAVLGWKIAATSANGQQHIGVDAPIAGRLFASRVLAHADKVSMRGNSMAAAECEFVFRFAKPLPARTTGYTCAEVMAAVGSLHPGLELPDSRLRDFSTAGAGQLIADNACTHWMAVGAATQANWRDVDLRSHATALYVDEHCVTHGSGADVLGDPRDALTWLVNTLCAQNIDISVGQLVTTGVTGQPSPVHAGHKVCADLGAFGQVEVELVD